jgi:hypothetical protein
MNSVLRSRVIPIGLFVLAGLGAYSVYQRTPPGLPMGDLLDAGLLSTRDDRWVMACPEKLTQATSGYLRTNGYGTLRAGSIHRIARVVFQYNLPDGGRELINPSLDLPPPDGGEINEDDGDDALQFRTDDCFRLECDDVTSDAGRELNFLPDGGARYPFPDGGPRPWCGAPGRRGRITPPCVIPDCSLPDGGWDDNGPEVDCRGIGPFGQFPGGEPRWRGCNVGPAQFMAGAACIPVECSVVAGDGVGVLR